MVYEASSILEVLGLKLGGGNFVVREVLRPQQDFDSGLLRHELFTCSVRFVSPIESNVE